MAPQGSSGLRRGSFGHTIKSTRALGFRGFRGLGA